MARLTLMGDTIDEMGFMIPLSRLFSGEVIEGLKVVPTVPASTSVTVQPGSAFIRTGAAPSHYAYPICLNTTGGETVALPAAQSQPMIVDIVAALDIPAITASPDTNNPGTWALHAVAGTPNAVPSPPTNGQVQTAVNSKPFIRLGRMTHNAATQASGVTAIEDVRTIVSAMLSSAAYTMPVDANGWKRTMQLDGKIVYSKREWLELGSFTGGQSKYFSFGLMPEGVPYSTNMSLSLSFSSIVTGNNSATGTQAITGPSKVHIATGNNSMSVVVTNAYSSSTNMGGVAAYVEITV